MTPHSAALWLLEQEARALLARLGHMKPFAMIAPMVMAASVPQAAQTAMENHLIHRRRKLHILIDEFIGWVRSPKGQSATPAAAQSKLVFLRLRFNAVLSQFHIFADVLTQRSEHEMGVWIAGLDDFAADALSLPGRYYQMPPVVCYVDRGHGGAIRRARTRLPGGDPSPVAIIRIPHERMIGSGIASSLVHETGHEASHLLDLLGPLRKTLGLHQTSRWGEIPVWRYWERWISEILADLWGVSKVGVASTLGLISLVSLPRPFVFRVDAQDPHPTPWIRVKLSCAMGKELYPHQQWDAIASLWNLLYPIDALEKREKATLAALQAGIPEFVQMLVNFRPPSLRGRSLREVMPLAERHPSRLTSYYRDWKVAPAKMRAAAPSLVFAVIGQARADGKISPEAESKLLADLLSYWAMRSALDSSAICATTTPRVRLVQPPSVPGQLTTTLQ